MSLRYVIDGYNLTRHLRFEPFRKRSQDSCRSLLIFLKTYRPTGSLRNTVTVVFSCGVSADEKIHSLVEKAANPRVVVVVTDDREVAAAGNNNIQICYISYCKLFFRYISLDSELTYRTGKAGRLVISRKGFYRNDLWQTG